MGKIVTKAEFAKIRGRSPRQISNLIADGLPAEGTGKKGAAVRIDTEAAIDWLIQREVNRQRPAPDSPLSREEEELRLIRARANKTEAEDQIMRQESCRVEDARQALLGLGALLVSEVNALPGRLAHVAQQTTDAAELREYVDDECRRLRTNLADRLKAAVGDLGGGEPSGAAAEANGMAVGGGETKPAE